MAAQPCRLGGSAASVRFSEALSGVYVPWGGPSLCPTTADRCPFRELKFVATTAAHDFHSHNLFDLHQLSQAGLILG